MDVFVKMQMAKSNGLPVTLSAAELRLLLSILGDSMAEGKAQLKAWRKRLEDFDRAEHVAKSR